jgi:NADH-quinone oxidoreductase subunit L
MSSLETMLIAGVLSPLLAFLLLAFFGARLGKPAAGYVAVLGILASAILGSLVFAQWHGMSPDQQADASEVAFANSVHWADMGGVKVLLGVNLDSLTVIMYFMVAVVSTCIFIFSLGYMAGHSDEVDGRSLYHRFFTYLSLFAFSMLGLVIANSLLFLFVFWELVGLCSYLLIGFYFHKKSASDAAIKAFVTNRVGDFGFLIGLMIVYSYLQDLSLQGAAGAFAIQHDENGPLFSTMLWGQSLATWMGIGLFCGAVGKSAQVPLQVWLPDAMEGPTPVSALIHAATMVAAGVYLVARIFLLLTPQAQFVIACIGCITLAMAALIAIVQTDIKRVLAYSTVSQLGYMIFGLGIGAWTAALFHLLTHAFFKALMFLGSGQVIEGAHHEQDIRKMGGLIRKMPVTGITFLVGVLAIAGAGIPGVSIGQTKLGIAGFFSKDEILAVAYHRTHEVAEHPQTEHDGGGALNAGEVAAATARLPGAFFWIPTIIAYVTAFYMMRCWWLTFMGKPRDPHVYEHAHESPLMYLPLVVLAIGALLCGYVWFRPMVFAADPDGFLVPTVDGEAGPGMHAVHGALVPRVGFAFVVGFALAIAIYARGLATATKIKEAIGPLHTILERKFFFDDVYNSLLVAGTVGLARLSRMFDNFVVDGLVNLSAAITERLSALSGLILDARGIDGAVNGLGNGAWNLAGILRRAQNGNIRNYVMFATGSAAAIVVLILFVR